MVYLITACGHHALEAHEGAEGLRKARLERPDLILLDIHMPQMDGYEVARRLRADRDCSKIPIVAVTALAMVGDREKILAAGFDGYIAKPIESELFLSQVNAFLSGPRRSLPPRPFRKSLLNSSTRLGQRSRRSCFLSTTRKPISTSCAAFSSLPVTKWWPLSPRARGSISPAASNPT